MEVQTTIIFGVSQGFPLDQVYLFLFYCGAPNKVFLVHINQFMNLGGEQNELHDMSWNTG